MGSLEERNIMLTLDEYLVFKQMIGSGLAYIEPSAIVTDRRLEEERNRNPKKRKVSAYNRRYKAAFKKVAPRYKLKSGKWKAGGFRRAVKEAHKLAGRNRK